ncbi:MAG TPA: 16S rRNA (cytosine(1402)-N(4))-methyltransferase RsmH [Thermodesulfobacteriota bacterium]|nr:16S rRNA (cytosine(1402)-N(4))-methyltransferase RsmH [Thermodesulfobacteriota bacterium]HQO77503.1 16S rRNA (cytosine(1402)-N(4))-methyltransferase RsmH [Thermodesulfobacteriota bacterium]
MIDDLHQPVLCEEAISLLNCHRGGRYVDGTIGGGGHARYLLQTCPDIEIFIGIDRDQEALDRSRKRIPLADQHKCIFVQRNYAEIKTVLHEAGIETVDGILLDLGISRYQLKTPERGFSFSLDGPLDMRMDQTHGTTAQELINTLSEQRLTSIVREYGEERWASAIAKKIVQRRKEAPITTTRELADLIFSTIPRGAHPRAIHPATRTFQALRIAVNDELTYLQKGLQDGIDVLAPGGRIVVISFHSLEDRIVKRMFQYGSAGCVCPPRLVTCRCGHRPILTTLTRKPVVPSESEITRNPLARSARLRAAEKLPA